jgi:hypothetical protein
LKRDNNKKTGGEGGREKELSEVEKFIISIVGSSSVAVDGLDVGESGVSSRLELEPDGEEEDFEPGGGNYRSLVTASTASTSAIVASSSRGATSTSSLLGKRKQKNRNGNDEESKKFLQCQLMDIKIYKHRLECYKFEQELGFPTSSFTRPLFDNDH